MPEPIPNPNPNPAPSSTPPPAPAPPAELDLDAEFAAEAKAAMDAPPAQPEPKKDEPPAKPAGQAPTKPTPPAPKPPEGPKQLREELERVRGERDTFKQQQAALEKRIADAEAKGKDTAALAERATALEKTIAERDAELRMLKHEASPEFKDKYEKPFTEAAEYAREVVTQLTVTTETDGIPSTRPATWDDFAALYSMPYSKAIEQANAMFGPGAQLVINHLTELHRIDRAKSVALKAEREQASTRMKEEEGKRVQEQEATNAALALLSKELPEKFEAYRDPPEDKELADARAKGFAIFDAPPKSPQQAMVKFAHIRQRVAAFQPLLVQINRLKAEVEKLKGELDGKKVKEPQPGRRPGGGEIAGGDETWEEAAAKELSNVQ